MKKIFQIARLELNTLFYSPIAWLLLIILFIQSALNYCDYLQTWVTQQELGGSYREYMGYLTSNIFGSPIGMTPMIARNLYLYLPLLTMGLISREVSSGTIKLLYSSPLKTKDIVLGKYLAVIAYSFLFTLVIGVFLLTGTFHLENADKGLMLSILLGVFLLLCTYGAIGLFVSCLTSYQVVAAISTFVFFAFLNYIGSVWQDIDLVRDITYSLSLAGRTHNMMSGLITTKDLCYFSMIIIAFICFSIFRLQGSRSTESGLKKTLKYFLVTLSVFVVGYFTSRPTYTGYMDATETKTRTLTQNVQQIISKMNEGPLEVTSYINLLDDKIWYGLPVLRNEDMERWLSYIRFKPDIHFEYVYYYDSVPGANFHKQYPKQSLEQIAANFAKSMRLNVKIFKKPTEIRRIIDLRPEQNRYVMQLKYQGRSTFLRLFDDPLVFPSEQETGAALKRLIVPLPKIAFLEGELERSPARMADKDYKLITSEIGYRYSMVNQGFDFITMSLKDGDIPKDVSALVIADPKVNFDTAVLSKVGRYIEDGGNLLIAGEPGKQKVLNPLLQKLGIQMTDGMIVQESEEYSPSLTLPYLTASAAALSKTMERYFRDSALIGMPSAGGLSYKGTDGFTVEPFLMTHEEKSWLKAGELSSDSIKVSFMASEGDRRGKFCTMLALSRKMKGGKEQHIVVSSDADFMSSMELSRYAPVTRNFALSTNLFGWLSNGSFPIDVARPRSKDRHLNLAGDDIPMLRILLIGVIPFIIFISGTILLVRRKKQ